MTAMQQGKRIFTAIWFGQIASLMGSSMSRFALLIWVWGQTESATSAVLIGVSATIPSLLLTPIAGALIDRWNRRWVMIVADLLAGLTTVLVLLLFTTGSLQLWHLYLVSAIAGGLGIFQYLAYSTTITLLLPKEQYARASGLVSLAGYASKIGAPLLAGLLIGSIGIQGILLIDIATFLFAVATLLVVRFPQPEPVETEETGRSLWRDSIYGFRYILKRPSLTGLMLVAFAFSAAEALGYPLIAPMILARTGNDETVLGLVQATLGVGGVLGAVWLSAWGGPKRRIHGLLLGLVLTGLFGDALMGLGRGLPVWLIAAIGLELFIPLMLGSNQAIWQSKVPPALQGRVFAARSMIASLAEPVSMITAGVLADRVFEPGLMPGGALVTLFGGLVGVGPGAGMGLILFFCGLLSAGAALAGYAFESVRNVEDHLPDHDAEVIAAPKLS